MTDQPATLSQDGDVSIITLDDGKANVFSKNMSDTLEALLDQVPDDKGSLLAAAHHAWRVLNLKCLTQERDHHHPASFTWWS